MPGAVVEMATAPTCNVVQGTRRPPPPHRQHIRQIDARLGSSAMVSVRERLLRTAHMLGRKVSSGSRRGVVVGRTRKLHGERWWWQD